jgi:hypothetical protein
LRWGAVCGISAREAMVYLTVGEVSDQYELYLQAYGVKQEDEE